MSATGRSEIRREKDHYVTPPWAVERLLESLHLSHGASVLDPCAANGELLTEIKRLRPDLRLFAIELREECRGPLAELLAKEVIEGFEIGDFFKLSRSIGSGEIDYIVTNPPYSLAQDFIEKGNRIAKISNNHLLRINFLGSQERHAWTVKNIPSLRILPNRPSFTGWGGDATEYAWFTYFPDSFGDNDKTGTLRMLALTPDEVISAWNAKARKMFPESKPERKSKRKKAADADTAPTQ